MESHIGNIMTLSNSIIGVSILAMPFCFKQCGIVLATLMLITSSIVTRCTSHFLLKSAIMARRKSFELLAFHAFGTAGKFVVELGIIGFLMGTCIAFFVIIGDLGPAIIAKIMGTKPTDTLRIYILIGVAVFCVVPLGLLKNVDSLHSVCTATIGFYFCLVLKTISESTSRFLYQDWLENVELWRPAGILQCLPIFSMALSCQTQLFEIYDSVVNPNLDKMNYIVRFAVNICVCVYVSVGFFGYVAFSSEAFAGNILMSFKPSIVTDLMKIGFVLSVAFSFPLVIFPCRASLYSLLFKKGYIPHEGASNYIPESRFKCLTLMIVFTSLVIGILIPNIEVVLGLVGSTIGIMICLIFPVTCFICISTKNTNERLLAQIILFLSVIVMVLGTYANLYAMEEIKTNDENILKALIPKENEIYKMNDLKKFNQEPEIIKNIELIRKVNIVDEPKFNKEKPENMRLEPPQPIEPQEIIKTESSLIEQQKVEHKIDTNIIPAKDEKPEQKLQNQIPKIDSKKTDEVNIDAIKKEDTELQEEAKEDNERKVNLIHEFKKQEKQQKIMLEEQKNMLEEIKKANQEAADKIVEIAKKALEKLVSENENTAASKNNVEMNQFKSYEQITKKMLNISNKTKQVLNQINPIDRMLPLPMAKNKTFSELLYKTDTVLSENNAINSEVNKNIEMTPKVVENNVINSHLNTVVTESILSENKAIDSNIKNNEIIQTNENILNPIVEYVKPTILKENPPADKLEKLPKENIIPAKRDILTNDIIHNRIKREIENNEKCEMTEKIISANTQSPPPVQISNSDLLIEESNIVIDALKTQLKMKTVHLKKKK